ncbi:MAG TPA: hypothetical protein VII06_07870 [Chloroflexota bacterium]|jgi:DNA-directed RNA polymerase subunit RPC12/RpoP
MSGTPVPRCPDCGGNLYLEPDLIEAMADLVCLQCSRRFHQRPGSGRLEAARGPASNPAAVTPADAAGDPP